MKIGLHEFRLAQDGDALAALLSATRGKPVGRADVADRGSRSASTARGLPSGQTCVDGESGL